MVFFSPFLSNAQKTLFRNANVVDVLKGKIIANQYVFIEGNRMKKISSKAFAVSGATIVNGTGKYLIPGLCDFNAYVLQYENEGVLAFKLMLANGVTSVRDLLPPYSPAEAFKIKKVLQQGKYLHPGSIYQEKR